MKSYTALLWLIVLCAFASCEIDEQFDPNGPSIASVLNNATPAELSLLATGIEASMRNGYAGYVTASGSVARELYIFDADPRNTEDLLGKGDLVLDANTFYITGPFGTAYRTVKNVNVLLEALENTDLVTEAEKEGYRGFAKTVKAHMLSRVLDMLGDNGIRVDVSDPENLGSFLDEDASYSAILNLLDEAHDHLQGANFIFTLSERLRELRYPRNLR